MEYKGTKRKYNNIFLVRKRQVRRQWSIVFQVLKGNKQIKNQNMVANPEPYIKNEGK